MAQKWVRRTLGSAARSIGVQLARLLETGAIQDEMVMLLEEALSAATSTSASYRSVG
jgi:hypothetical protein